MRLRSSVEALSSRVNCPCAIMAIRIEWCVLVHHPMAADLHRNTADLCFPVALHGLLEGPPPLFRDGLPSDLEVHIVAVIPAAVGVAGLVKPPE